MIIANQAEVTKAALTAMAQTHDPRLRAIMTSLVTHLHAFVRETRLTEDEFRAAAALVAELGQSTTDTHNEAILMAGSLGVSSLVCLLNNGDGGETESSQNLLGPFWRMYSPRMENGSSIVRSPTPGPIMITTFVVRDSAGKPVTGAEVDIWHASPVGFYENQDEAQADMNLRGTFTTDADGRICAGFSDAGNAELSTRREAGVGEAPRHEVAGRGVVLLQRALWRLRPGAGLAGDVPVPRQ